MEDDLNFVIIDRGHYGPLWTIIGNISASKVNVSPDPRGDKMTTPTSLYPDH